MGSSNNATCLKCGHHFQVSHGGGFVFHLLRCDACGNTKPVGFDEIHDLHNRYLKGLDGPYCVATAEHDRQVQENFMGKPISDTKYHQGVEEHAGSCKCGGEFKFDAPLRCAKCRSLKIKESEEDVIMYD